MSPYSLIEALVAVALIIGGQLLLKRAMSAVGPIGRARLKSPGALLLDMASRWQLWAGAALYLAAAAAWILALSTAPPQFAYPFWCLTYFSVAVAAVALLRERLTPAQWLGVMLIIVGVAIVGLNA